MVVYNCHCRKIRSCVKHKDKLCLLAIIREADLNVSETMQLYPVSCVRVRPLMHLSYLVMMPSPVAIEPVYLWMVTNRCFEHFTTFLVFCGSCPTLFDTCYKHETQSKHTFTKVSKVNEAKRHH